MAYQLKYWYQFGDMDNDIHRVEIWQNTDAILTAQEVISASTPISIEMPKLDHKFQVVRGRGCELNLISETNMQFFKGLYHVDKKEFMIKHYINSEVNYLGYLISELMRESYSYLTNYEMQVTGNDGFSLLERIQFVNLDGSICVGIRSQFEILKDILVRLELPFLEIRIHLSTVFAEFSGDADKTILHESFLDCANFYNEDSEAETMRKVVESILAPYGAIITQIKGIIYIVDINSLALALPITYKRFGFTSVEPVGLDGTIETVQEASGTATARKDKATIHDTVDTCDVTCNGTTHQMTWEGSTSATIDHFLLLYASSYPGVYLTKISSTEFTMEATVPGVDFVGETEIGFSFGTVETIQTNVSGTPQIDEITLSGNGGTARITINSSSVVIEFAESLENTASLMDGSVISGVSFSHSGIKIIATGYTTFVSSIENLTVGETISDYLGEIEINHNKTISEIGYLGTDSDIEISGGKNKQVVAYSPYPIKTILEKSIADLGEFNFIDLAWSTKNGILYKTLSGNEYWTGTAEVTKYSANDIIHVANFAALPEYGEKEKTYITDDTGYHYRWNGYVYTQVDSTVLYGSEENIHFVVEAKEVNELAMKLKAVPVLVLPKSDYIGIGSATKIAHGAAIIIKGKFGMTLNTGDALFRVSICLKIKVGDLYFNGVNWTTTENFFRPIISENEKIHFEMTADPNYRSDFKMIKLGNQGIDGIFIPITNDLSGVLSVEIWTEFGPDTSWIISRGAIAWFSNLSITIAQPDGTDISDSDVEYTGYLDARFKDEAEKITLLCGTEMGISDRAKILFSDSGIYKPIKSWTRSSQTYKIEELLLNSLSSNYRAGYYTLQNMKLKNTFDQLTIFTDEFTDDRKFMLNSSNKKYRDSLDECELIEISPDELTIEK